MSKEEFIIKVKELGLVLTDKELNNLDRYYQILKEENSKYNLTRIIEEEEVYLKHFYDSLTITKVVNIDNQSICDLGSGAGFPGLVLAICFPNAKLTLIEANGRSVCITELKGYQETSGEPVFQPRRPNSRLDKIRHMFQKIM